MVRLPRVCLSGIPQHIIQRGNNRQICFVSENDFAAYAHWLYQYSNKYDVAIHAWVFMTNHVHILATAQTDDGMSKMMQSIGRQYVRYFNYTYKRTGTLWEGRFKSCVVEQDNYLLACQRYIELNPVRANMVTTPSEYKWSSYHSNGFVKKSKIWQPHFVYLALGKTDVERARNYRELFKDSLNERTLCEIRQATNKNMALGSDRFKKEIERLSGRRVSPLKRGPKTLVINIE